MLLEWVKKRLEAKAWRERQEVLRLRWQKAQLEKELAAAKRRTKDE